MILFKQNMRWDLKLERTVCSLSEEEWGVSKRHSCWSGQPEYTYMETYLELIKGHEVEPDYGLCEWIVLGITYFFFVFPFSPFCQIV
jgi:hypothetical protein